MKRCMYYNVCDCEHEGDVNHAINELTEVCSEIDIHDVDYEYEDDEDADAEHEICGCTITFTCPAEFVDKFIKIGAYTYD